MARARVAVCVAAAIAVGLFTLPASASAGAPFHQVTVVKPTGVAFDPYSPHTYVTQIGPPPGIQVWHENEDGSVDLEDLIPLPADSDPGDIYYDREDDEFIVQDHAKDRYFTVCPDCGSVQTHDLLASPNFATGVAYGYNTWVMSDFGDGTGPGSLFYGPNFTSRLQFGDTIVPNGVALLTGIGRIRGSTIPSEFLVIDAQNNDLIAVSDAKTPAVIGTEPGPPGASGLAPPRDVAVDPINLNPDPLGPATHLVLVPVPDLGNVFVSRNGSGPWQPISATPFGRPVRVDASCSTIGVTDFTNNQVTFFNEKPPKNAGCEDVVDLVLGGGSGVPFTEAGKFAVGMKAFVDAGGDLKAQFGAGWLHAPRVLTRARGGTPLARKVSTGAKKVRLVAGKVSRVNLQFPRWAARTVLAGLQRHRRISGALTLRVKTPSGRRFKTKRRFELRAAH